MKIKDLFKFKDGKTSFIFVGGKGGVGKTSVSAATAIYLAKQGKKTLIVSTDPAHSLSDSLETYVGPYPKMIMKNLYGVEIDPEMAVEKQQAELKSKKSLASPDQLPGLDLLGDQLDLASSSPGSDEAAAFEIFMEVMTTNEYDVVVFDTAPTGHTLRFLSFPDLMDSWVGKMIKAKTKLGSVTSGLKNLIPFVGGEDEDIASTAELEETKRKISEAKKVLTNPELTSFKMIVIPEEMSIYESERAIESLKKNDMNVDSVIVNQVMPDIDNCDFCQSRYKIQQKRLGLIHQKFQEQVVEEIPLFKEEVKGEKKLEELAEVLYEGKIIEQSEKDTILL
ncbi:ArsA family ATPase [Methanobrevibacter curvatus]|uniref:Putative arsenical pump-driving ATPase n=1 Tax=Methanobrevibacter curvatus TaxID=49547 RepID=A0A166B2C7_9EURY|nr:TRC40/GET3/ArsA family transport-energizing ATPase [Methanobrevibacter curvatus]KZX12778.1 arsenical pump-driving ATPase [Methanobrevibacter curvatus]